MFSVKVLVVYFKFVLIRRLTCNYLNENFFFKRGTSFRVLIFIVDCYLLSEVSCYFKLKFIIGITEGKENFLFIM